MGGNEETNDDTMEGNQPIQVGALEGEGEDEIRRIQMLDFVSTLSILQMVPTAHSRRRIPSCRLVPMPMIRPTLSCDLTKLEQQFSHRYEDGARVFYVFLADKQRQMGEFSKDEKREWGPLWNSVNDAFNSDLRSVPELRHLADAKFYVCDGNHRCVAWMRHIQRLYSADIKWHILVDSIILDTRGRVGVAMHVIQDINK